MATVDTNAIGDLGETIASLRLAMFFIFRCYLIGGKAPVFDMLIELIDEDRPYQAMVQVKATIDANPYDTKGNIKTSVPDDKLQKLISRPLPTYAAGIDINKEIMYLAPAFDRNAKMPTIPPILVISHSNPSIAEANLLKLREDIINYWEGYNMHVNKPSYKSIL